MNNKPSLILHSKLVISLLAILVIVLATLGFVASSNTNLTNSKDFEGQIAELENTSDSDDTSDIENDLNNTDIDSTDAELLEIESELNTSY